MGTLIFDGFGDSRQFLLCFTLKITIFDEKIIAQSEHLTHAMTFDEGIRCHSTRI